MPLSCWEFIMRPIMQHWYVNIVQVVFGFYIEILLQSFYTYYSHNLKCQFKRCNLVDFFGKEGSIFLEKCQNSIAFDAVTQQVHDFKAQKFGHGNVWKSSIKFLHKS